MKITSKSAGSSSVIELVKCQFIKIHRSSLATLVALVNVIRMVCLFRRTNIISCVNLGAHFTHIMSVITTRVWQVVALNGVCEMAPRSTSSTPKYAIV